MNFQLFSSSIISLSCLFLLNGVGCKSEPQDISQNDLLGSIMEGSEYLWPQATAPVCWENTMPKDKWDKYADRRQKVGQYVTSQMSRAGFNLTGWQICEPSSRGIRVSTIEHTPGSKGGRVLGMGRKIDGIPNGLQFHIAWSACPSEEACYLSEALHEFGHAIGLAHESNRPDSPCTEDSTFGFGESTAGILSFRDYDRDSIMNYCKNTKSYLMMGKTQNLSDGDISAITSLYSGNLDLPRQDNCRKDGNSWVALAYNSCCRLAPGKIPPANPNYPICPADSPGQSPPQTQSSPGADSNPITRNQLRAGALLTIKVKLPFKTLSPVLICHENEYFPINFKPVYDNPMDIEFELLQNAGLGRDAFTCTHLDVYEDDGQNKTVDAIKKSGRMTFPTPIKIPVNQAEKKEDYTNQTWAIFENRPGGPPTVPVSPQPGTQSYEKTKYVSLSLTRFPNKTMLGEALLKCGSQKISAINFDQSTGEGLKRINFRIPEDQTCQGVDLKIAVPKTSSPDANKQSDWDPKFLALTFDTPVNIKDHNRPLINITMEAPGCLSNAVASSPSPSVPPVTPQGGDPDCDMSKAQENNGWGYNHKKKESCQTNSLSPQASKQPEPSPPPNSQETPQSSGDCSYADAEKNNGWGWDQKNQKPCPPR